MKLHAAGPSAYNTITGYGEDYVTVNGQRHQASIVVLPEKIIPWPAQGFDTLSAENFVFLKNLNAEIVLLGTGAKLEWPDTDLIGALAARGIGLEIMSTPAACRTFSVLVQEQRRVAAALFNFAAGATSAK